MDEHYGRFNAADIEYYYYSIRAISSGRWTDCYDGLFDHIIVIIETGIVRPWRQQGGRIDIHHGRKMCGRAFELVE